MKNHIQRIHVCLPWFTENDVWTWVHLSSNTKSLYYIDIYFDIYSVSTENNIIWGTEFPNALTNILNIKGLDLLDIGKSNLGSAP